MARVLSVRVGAVQERESPAGAWLSAIEKHAVTGPVFAGPGGFLGDAQADRVNHGGREKAILAYCSGHYPLWREELRNAAFGPGALGENLEIAGQSEAEVCIGDRYRVGETLLEVSQPRQPCWKPAQLNGYPFLTKRMAETSRTGWYLRVLENGFVEAPCEVILISQPHPDWTVLRANRLVYRRAEPKRKRLELAALPELSTAWREMLRSG